MRYSIAALAIAGTVAAAPSRHIRDTVVQQVQVVQDVDWVTDVVTVVGNAPAPTPVVAPAPAQATTLITVVTVAAQAPDSAPPAQAAPAAQAPAAASPAPQAASSPSSGSSDSHNQVASGAGSGSAPASGSSSSSDPNSPDAMLAVANLWRQNYNLPAFTWNDELAGNAQKTGNDDGGSDEKHELNSISMAQVITPGITDCSQASGCGGSSSGFALAYLAGWLCEKPKAPLTSAMCSAATGAAHMDLSSGETGHADILNNPDYKQIGCAFATNPNVGANAQWTGLWICDLA